MRVWSFSSVSGLDRNRFTAATVCKLCVSRSLSVIAECIAITVSFAPGMSRNARATSSPVMSGNLTSHRTISGWKAVAVSSASRPVAAIRTSSPVLRMNSAVASARGSWSSISNTRRRDWRFFGWTGCALGKTESCHVRDEKSRTTNRDRQPLARGVCTRRMEQCGCRCCHKARCSSQSVKIRPRQKDEELDGLGLDFRILSEHAWASPVCQWSVR